MATIASTPAVADVYAGFIESCEYQLGSGRASDNRVLAMIDQAIDHAILLLSRPACRVDVFDATHQMPVATITATPGMLLAVDHH